MISIRYVFRKCRYRLSYLICIVTLPIIAWNRLVSCVNLNYVVFNLNRKLHVTDNIVNWLPQTLDCYDASVTLRLPEQSVEPIRPGVVPPLVELLEANREREQSVLFRDLDSRLILHIFWRGFVALYDGDSEGAIFFWRHAPEIANYFVRAGEQCSRNREYLKAAENYRIALGIDSSFVEVYERLAYAYGLAGEEEKAISAFDLGAENAPANFERLTFAGRASLQRDDSRKAATYFTRAQNLDPTSSEAAFRLGLAKFYNANYEQAVRHFTTATVLDPGNWQIHYYLGQVYEVKDALEIAHQEYVIAIELAPDNIECRLALASLSERMGNLARALSEYLAVLELAPSNTIAIFALERIKTSE